MSHKRILIALPILLCILVAHNSYADINMGKITTGTVFTTSPKLISITLSGSCLALVKLNQTDDCPSYNTIYPHDNSNQIISGKFTTTNGFFHRGYAHTILHYQMYNPDHYTIMVDPSSQAISHSQEIIIVPHGFTYTSTHDNSTNNTRTEYHDRFVTPDCKTARIDYSEFLLNDTISYMESDCKVTSFHEAVKITKPYHPTDYTSSQDYKYNKWLKQAKSDSKGNCITTKCPATKDVNSKWK